MLKIRCIISNRLAAPVSLDPATETFLLRCIPDFLRFLWIFCFQFRYLETVNFSFLSLLMAQISYQICIWAYIDSNSSRNPHILSNWEKIREATSSCLAKHSPLHSSLLFSFCNDSAATNHKLSHSQEEKVFAVLKRSPTRASTLSPFFSQNLKEIKGVSQRSSSSE